MTILPKASSEALEPNSTWSPFISPQDSHRIWGGLTMCKLLTCSCECLSENISNTIGLQHKMGNPSKPDLTALEYWNLRILLIKISSEPTTFCFGPNLIKFCKKLAYPLTSSLCTIFKKSISLFQPLSPLVDPLDELSVRCGDIGLQNILLSSSAEAPTKKWCSSISDLQVFIWKMNQMKNGRVVSSVWMIPGGSGSCYQR